MCSVLGSLPHAASHLNRPPGAASVDRMFGKQRRDALLKDLR